MYRRFYLIFLLLFSLGQGILAQESESVLNPVKIYSDRITDQDGKPLSGIRIRVKGSGNTTITDVNGQFSINAKNGDVIVLSKDGKIINSYRLDGSVYYEVDDSSDRLFDRKEPATSSRSKKARLDNTTSFNRVIDSASFYKKVKPVKSIDFIETALKLAGQSNNKTQLAMSYNILAEIYMNLDQTDLAVSNYSLAVQNSDNTVYQFSLARALLSNGEYSKSKEQYESLQKKSGISTRQKLEIYEGLGDVAFNLKEFSKAQQEYETALNLSKRLATNKKTAALNLKISAALEAKGETEQAEGYLLKSNLESDDNPEKAVIESKRAADFYSRNQNIDKEVEQRQATLKNLEDADLDEIVVENQVPLTKPKAKLELGNALLKQNKPKEAIQILEESAAEAENKNDVETQKNAVQKLSEAYVSLGNDDQALANYKKYVSLVDILYKEKEKEIKAAVSLNKDLSEKQNRITSLEKDRQLNESKFQLFQTENRLTLENDRRQRIIIYALLSGLVLLLFSLFWMIKSNRQKRLANNLLALKSLRTQMNPHFIFNALNSVNSFIAKNDERTANRYLTDFSTLMRSVLLNSEEDFISLEKELELLNLYLKLEHSRFEDKFDYELTLDENIEPEQFQIPPMLLQPYVENAVWHGLRYKKAKGFLKVHIEQLNKETLQIMISDNGIGRKESMALKTDHQKKQRSKGMQNINQRIAILNEMYKDKVDVFIEDLYEDETGTKVTLTLKKD